MDSTIQHSLRALVVTGIIMSLLSVTSSQGTDGICMTQNPDIISTQVAKICEDSEATGENVYLDMTDSTGQLMNICTCQIYLGDDSARVSVNFSSADAGSSCGYSLEFRNDSFITTLNCQNHDAVKLLSNNFTVELNLTSPDVSFCVSLEGDSCSKDQFQCSSGECIPESDHCNTFPDCSDGSDEVNCGITCPESQIPCDNGTGCFSADQRCNNITDCPDESDESPKYCDQSSTIATTVASRTEAKNSSIICTKPPPSTESPTIPTTPGPSSSTTISGPSSSTSGSEPGTRPSLPDETSDDNLALILGITLGCLAVVVIVVIVILCVRNRSRIGKYVVQKIFHRRSGNYIA